MVKLVKPTPGHALYIGHNMRDEDRVEVVAAGHDPLEAMISALGSDFSVSVVSEEGVPLSMLGVSRSGFLTGTGVPWLLSSKDAMQYKREFLEKSPAVVEEMLTVYPRLMNTVHHKNHTSIRWLKWLGFTIHYDEPIIVPSTNETFYKFTLER